MTYRARTDHFEQLVDDLERVTAALTHALEDADSASKRLHGVWEGEAADAHGAAHASWSGEATRMTDALAQMRAVLQSAQGNYASAAGANTKTWG